MKHCGIAISILLLPALLSISQPSDVRDRKGAASRINRNAWVTRHNPTLHALDVDAPLTVGNGGFAFTADITGLQTFAELLPSPGNSRGNSVALGLAFAAQSEQLQTCRCKPGFSDAGWPASRISDPSRHLRPEIG